MMSNTENEQQVCRRSRKFLFFRKYSVKCISSLCIPLLLATFTVVITLVQHKDNQLQRNEDKEIARIQREQDLNISRVLADERRQLETDLAAKTRDADNIQHQHELNIQGETYRDAVLSTYTNDVAILSKETNGSLTRDPIIHAIVRTKTLHVLRQINSVRAGQVLRFLIDAKQLTLNNPLDLSTAIFGGVDYSGKNLQSISLRGVSLSHALFNNTRLNELDLNKAILHYTNFSEAFIETTNFGEANIEAANFIKAFIDESNFTLSSISHSSFWFTWLTYTTFLKAFLYNITFVQMQLADTEFRDAHFIEVTFDSSLFSDVSSRHSTVDKSRFHNSELVRLDFSYSKFINIDFNNAVIRYSRFDACDFHNVSFVNVSFDYHKSSFICANLTNVNFFQVKNMSINWLFEKAIYLENITLPNGTLYSCTSSSPFPSVIKAVCSLTRIEDDGWKIVGQAIIAENRSSARYGCIYKMNFTKNSHRISMSKTFQVPGYCSEITDYGSLELIGFLKAGYRTIIIVKTIHNSNILQKEEFTKTFDFKMLLHPQTSEIEFIIDFNYAESDPQDFESLWFDSVKFTWRVKDMVDND